MRLANWKQLKVRQDLQVSPQSQEGETVYVVKDPVTLRYFRLRPVEYAIFRMLDGETPADAVRERLKSLGFEIGEEEMQAFLKQLGSANFFENVLPGQSDMLYQAAALRRSRRSLWQQAKRILYVKIRLVDPNRAFNRVMPWIGFLWSRWMMAAYAALLVFSFYAVAVKWDEARAAFSGLLAPDKLLLIPVVFLIIKVFHELGHGLTCKRFGGDVHDMGILVLCLFPCLYCNISDAWIMEKRSRRMWISAAGIVTEVVIASLATVVWWSTGPGPVNSIACNVMIVAGVSSVIMNGNPLMKWDGYYILSDVLGMPNLRANSVAYMWQFARKYVLGLPTPAAGPFTRARLIHLVYGVVSTWWILYIMYRITYGMLNRFPAIGVWVLIMTLYGIAFVPLVRLAKMLQARRKGPSAEVDLQRMAVIAAVLTVAAYALFVRDWGYSVTAPCAIEPGRRQYVLADTAGVLVEMPWRQGDIVREGEVVARLENRSLESELRKSRLVAEISGLEAGRSRAASRYAERDVYLEARAKAEENIARLEREAAALTIRAPFTATVLSGQPESQLGRYVDRGDLVCELGDLDSARVTIAVGEQRMRFIREGARASVRLRAYPWKPLGGSVDSIASSPLNRLPSFSLSSHVEGPVVARPDVNRVDVPIDTLYEVSIVLPNADHRLLVGMVGEARIASDSRRWYERIYVIVRESLRKSFGV